MTINSISIAYNPQAKSVPAKAANPNGLALALGHEKQSADGSVQVQVSANARVVNAVSEFKDNLADLRKKFDAPLTHADSKDKSVATANTNNTAHATSFDIKVTNLATAQQLKSASFTSSETVSGTVKIASSSGSFKVAVSGNIKHVAEAINAAKDNIGVSASVSTDANGDHLVLRATKTGTDSAFTVATTSASEQDTRIKDLSFSDTSGGTGLSVSKSAGNSAFEIDGRSYTSQSNQVSSVVAGVTLNLKSVGETNISVARSERNSSDLGKEASKAVDDLVGKLEAIKKTSPEATQSVDAVIARVQSDDGKGNKDNLSGLRQLDILSHQSGKAVLRTSNVDTLSRIVLGEQSKSAAGNASNTAQTDSLFKKLVSNLDGNKAQSSVHDSLSGPFTNNGASQRSDTASETLQTQRKKFQELAAMLKGIEANT